MSKGCNHTLLAYTLGGKIAEACSRMVYAYSHKPVVDTVLRDVRKYTIPVMGECLLDKPTYSPGAFRNIREHLVP